MNRFFSQKKQETKVIKTNTKSRPVFSQLDFPDLIETKSANTTLTHMNYKKKLEILEPVVESKIKPGYISLSYDKITRKLCIETNEIKQLQKRQQSQRQPLSFQKLVNHWEKWYDDYIDLYGEEIYSDVHLYPFYNYNYFNELDEIFYKELEEFEKMEDVEYEEYDN